MPAPRQTDRTPEAAVYTFNGLSATGTSLLLTGIASGLLAVPYGALGPSTTAFRNSRSDPRQ